MDKTTKTTLIAILLVAVITVTFLVANGMLESTGSYSTKLSCDSQRTKLLSGAYVVCTPCSTTYDTGGYYAAGCFLSGTRGEQCLLNGGSCNDVYCTVCSGQTKVCIETPVLSTPDSDSTKNVYIVNNWGGVCTKTVYRTVCKTGYALNGAEYSGFNNLGSCSPIVPPTIPPSGCVSNYENSCSTSDGCGHNRVTDGISCSNTGYCTAGSCNDACAGMPVQACDGTTLKTNLLGSYQNGQATCDYATTKMNSVDCGFVAPVVPPDETVACTNCNAPAIKPTSWWDNFLNWLKALFSN